MLLTLCRYWRASEHPLVDSGGIGTVRLLLLLKATNFTDRIVQNQSNWIQLWVVLWRCRGIKYMHNNEIILYIHIHMQTHVKEIKRHNVRKGHSHSAGELFLHRTILHIKINQKIHHFRASVFTWILLQMGFKWCYYSIQGQIYYSCHISHIIAKYKNLTML